MTHHLTDMTVMESPAKTLGEIISNVDLRGDVLQLDLLLGSPLLNGKSLHSNMLVG